MKSWFSNCNLLANETASGTPLKGNFGHMTKATVYLLVYHMKYSFNGDRIEEYEGNFVPTAITLMLANLVNTRWKNIGLQEPVPITRRMFVISSQVIQLTMR